MDARQLALRCRELAEDKKAEDIIILDMRKLSSVADYFVIATGTGEPHFRAIIEELTERIAGEFGLRPRATDGTLKANWIVLDYFNVLVHLMRTDVRQRYDLEHLWGDAPRVRPRRPSTKSRARRAKTPTAEGQTGSG